MHGMRRPLRHGIFVLATIIASSGPAFADPWYEHYARAEQALEEENWTEAIEQINEALARKGDSGARVRTYGMKIISYFPYYKLGVAYYQLGQLDAALQAFETEIQIGAVRQSDPDYAQLRRFRKLAQDAKDEAARAETERIRQIVRDSLSRAKNLEDQGQLDEAMSALSQALAVSPQHSESLAAMERLKNKVAAEQEAREVQERVGRLTDEGKSLLEAGQYSEASSILRQAIALSPSDELQTLLDDAQQRLRAQIQAAEASENRQSMVNDGLAEARRLEEAGRIGESLETLQSVLALDPSNAQAARMQLRLLQAQSARDEERARRQSIENLLTEADDLLRTGRFEQCLSTANRVLALDPGNTNALQYVGRAYQQINQRLLGAGPRGNIPPAIRFADLRQEMDDGLLAQIVERSDFRLSGVVIDDSPVEIVFFDSDDGNLPASSTSQSLGDYTITEFNVSTELKPGFSTIRMTATDSQNLSSSSEYVVIYERPFFRSPWFFLVSTALALGAVGLVYTNRLRQRKRLRQRRFNPYVAGAPVIDANLFFGREALIDRILQTIHNNSLLLYGERRIGKTSVQHHLKRRLETLEDPEYDFYPVYIDLQGTPEEKFFSTLAEDIFGELAPILNGLQMNAPTREGAVYAYRELVRDIQRVLKVLKQNSSKKIRLVLLMDEVDVLNEYDPRINQRLRSLFMKSFAENLVTVVSGVEIKKHWEGEGSPWYNFFEEVEVKPFGRADAEELIERPIRGIFKLERGAIDRIIDLTDGRPYLIQKLCVSLVNRLHEDNRRIITVADVEALGRPKEA
jgi:tetratricopeptide (TPR) repeat protein